MNTITTRAKAYAPRQKGQRRAGFYSTPETDARLGRLRDAYGPILGHAVSNSLLLRRALDVLEVRLANVVDGPDVLHEAYAMRRHMA